jgi:PAS domain S-box-containing protein
MAVRTRDTYYQGKGRLLTMNNFLHIYRLFPDPIFVFDQQQTLVYMNDEAEKLWHNRYRPAHLNEMFVSSVYLRLLQGLRKLNSGSLQERFEVGKWEVYELGEITMFPIPTNESPVLFTLVVRESRVHADYKQELEESKRKLEETQQLAKIGSWEMNLSNYQLTMSKELARIFDIDPSVPAAFDDLTNFLDEESRQRHLLMLQEHFEHFRDSRPYDAELRMISKKGRECWIHTRGKVVYDEQYKPIKVIGTTQDITDRKRAELELQRAKEVFEFFVYHHVDPIVLTDEAGMIASVNPKFEELFGWSCSELAGLHASQLPSVPEQYREDMKRQMNSILSGGNHIHSAETVRFTKSGETVQVQISYFAIRDRKGNISGGAAIIRDITEQKEAQLLLHRSDKMGVIGQLAAGIAHEIRNPLTAIKGFLQLMQNDSVQTNAGYVEIMMNELKRMESIIGEMLVLAKPQAVQFRERDVRCILREVTALLAPQALMHNVELEEHYPESVPSIYCEENQLKQVFINLIKNAIEATRSGGRVFVRVGKDEQACLYIRVIDEGVGIAPERIQRMGEPFYTTKDKGIGLGLMVSHKIVEEHLGKITFESKINEGTTVTVALPYRGERPIVYHS